MFACRKLQIIRNHDWFVTKHGERRSLRGLLTDYRTDNGSQFANSDTCYRVITCPAGGVKRSSVARITPLRPWGTQSRMRVRFRSDARLNSLALDDTTPVEHTPYYRADPPPSYCRVVKYALRWLLTFCYTIIDQTQNICNAAPGAASNYMNCREIAVWQKA